jgi:hypothetical protein
MAFAIAGFAPAAGMSKGAASPAIHTYRTADTIAAVMVAGYFAAIQTLIRKGDLVVVHADTGGTDTVHLIRCSVTGASIAFSVPNIGSVAGSQLLVRELALPVTAVANTDFTLAGDHLHQRGLHRRDGDLAARHHGRRRRDRGGGHHQGGRRLRPHPADRGQLPRGRRAGHRAGGADHADGGGHRRRGPRRHRGLTWRRRGESLSALRR